MIHCTPEQARYIADRADGKAIPAGQLGASVAGISSTTALRSLADQLDEANLQHIAHVRELQDALSHPKSIAAPAVFAHVLDPQELRVMLQSLQAGEISVSRSIELMEFWLDGNYSDDQVRQMPTDSALITDDKFPMELVRELRAEVAGLRAATPVVPAPIASAWMPIETAPKDMGHQLFLVDGYCAQGLMDANGVLNVRSEISPHWRKMRGKPTHWMPLPRAPGTQAAPVAQLSEPPRPQNCGTGYCSCIECPFAAAPTTPKDAG